MNRSTMPTILAALVLTLSQTATAQAQTPAPAVPASAAAQPQQQLLKAEELDQLVAPIALYPDTLLAEVLMASTYPLEIVQADRWVTANKALKGDPLKAAVDKQSWDQSVKSLIATPAVLAMMSEKLDWTQKLGDAVLAQQPDVMDAVQRLRTKAQANNKLASTKEQKVSVVQQQNKQVIVIEPAVPDTIYVPYYDPAVVYGDWAYPAYPPYYFAPPIGYLPGAVLATGIAFGAGYALGRWASGGNRWGGGVNWGGGNINVARPVNVNNINIGGGNNWQHNPEHRHGVKYGNANVQQKFGNDNARAGSNDRADFRGRGGEQVIKPGGEGRGDRPGTADRPDAGKRADAGKQTSAGAKDAKAGAKGAASKGATAKSAATKGAAAKGGAGGGPKRDSAMGNIQSGKVANAQAARGRESLGGGGGGPRVSAGGGYGGGAASLGGGGRMGGGGGFSGGGGGRGGGGGGGRRSDINLKHDITLLGRLDNGLGFYRYSYNGSDEAYVGVMAQEVQVIMPEAVVRGRDGYLRVFYDKLGVRFQTYAHWVASGARIPSMPGTRHILMQNW